MDNGKLMVIYGSNPGKMAYDIMTAGNVKDMLKKDMKIAIKPNLVVAKPSDSGATTSPGLVGGVIRYLKDNGFNNITIIEGSWVGDSTSRAYKICGYEELSSRYRVPLVDLKRDRARTFSYKGAEINVCASVPEYDFLINMPVLKAHCQTLVTCALKNMKGCIPDSEKRRFHTMGLHNPIALLNKFVKSHLIIVDGLMGDLTFEEGGTPVEMNRVIMGTDPVLVDSYAARLLGYAKEDIAYIVKAESLGVGRSITDGSEVVELNADEAPKKPIAPGRRVSHLAAHVLEDQACSACYGSLIHALSRMDENGRLRGLRDKVHIGQGYKGRTCQGLGVGRCTAGFTQSVKGCPPSARDIVEFLEEYCGR